MFIAHKRKADKKEQSLENHSRNVAEYCFQNASILGLCNLAKLTGLLHDWGKATADFRDYLRNIGDKHPTHAGLGACFVWQCWGKSEKEIGKKRTAQLISLCIYGHHAGLPDCLEISGHSPYLDGMSEQPEKYYDEAEKNFYDEVASQEELNELFALAWKELDAFARAKNSFEWGMLTRLLLSILVDADRWDAACFEYAADPFAVDQYDPPIWEELLFRLENYLGTLPQDDTLSQIRRDISQQCRDAGEAGPGIYTLSALTGGGKTYASLRFALAQAKNNQDQQRIFYFIPINTILDQNAKEIRDALGEYSFILEHHSDVVRDSEAEEENYRRLTERWDSRIILTSLVNFLDTLFQNGNGKVRRMHRLMNSVLIFDEIQALPPKCRELFKRALQFLVRCCNCTVLLCTATQPRMELEATELIRDVGMLYQKLNRVTYVPQLRPCDYGEAAREVASLFQGRQSVLLVANTKKAAWEIYQKVYKQLEKMGYRMTDIQPWLDVEEVDRRARESGADEMLCVHLSTLMCPEHRKEILRWVKAWLKKKKSVCCISTSLIEAGINVSFPIVIRSLAGVPGIIQAAGRCNRNCEVDKGVVYLWNLSEERLGQLPDIKRGKEISMNLLGGIEDPEEIGKPETIEKYFAKEEVYTHEVERYPYKEWNSDLVTMLSINRECKNAAKDLRKMPLLDLSNRLCQSFRTAGAAFKVIDRNMRTVLVPYGEGKNVIEKLSKQHSIYEEIQYLREAQQYGVDLEESDFKRFDREHGLYYVGEGRMAVLKEAYYDTRCGVRMTLQEL